MKQPNNTEDKEDSLKNTDGTDKRFPFKMILSGSVSLNFLAVIILLCTILIITSMISIANITTRDIGRMMNDHEYMKVGGEENFKLLREIQKDQMTSYIQDLSEKDPQYIESLKRKIKNLENGEDILILSEEEIDALKSDAHIEGNTGAIVTIMEFSNFLCRFCREFHNEWVIRDILADKSDTINYIFKHIPSKDYPNADIFARGAKCILSNTGWTSYVDFIETVFTGSKTETGATILYDFAEKAGISRGSVDTCMSSKEVTEFLDREMGQGRFFGIKSTPSVLLLNNITGEYRIIEGKVEKEVLEEVIRKVVE